MPSYVLRLLDACAVNTEVLEGEESLHIHLFGLNAAGETFKVVVDDFKPYFFCLVPDSFKKTDLEPFKAHLVSLVGNAFAQEMVCKLIGAQKFYGFEGDRKRRFVCMQFTSMRAYSKVKNLWFGEVPTRDTDSKFTRRPGFKWGLKPVGVKFRGEPLELYEAQIPPILRFFHVHDLIPTGWAEVTGQPVGEKTSTCAYEVRCGCAGIKSLRGKEDLVPYKICSFDIEASSRTGDFPMAIVDYRRTAQQMVEAAPVQSAAELAQAVAAAFGFADHATVEAVAPKRPVGEAWVRERTARWLQTPVDPEAVAAAAAALAGTGDSSDEEGDAAPSVAGVEGKTVQSVMADAEVGKDAKVAALTATLNACFPPLEGDQVTFIGSTFVRYGVAEPYLNHCIALGETAPVAGVVLESYATEREVLLAWTQLMQREDPDIVVGYNIFGFDEDFLFRRALETDCAREFLNLTRNRGAPAAERKQGEWKLTEKSIFLATGEYDLKYFNLEGRVQIDLYTMFRKENYSFESFKLDDVAAILISDRVARVEYDCSADTMRVFTKKTKGIAPGNYVVFEYFTHSSSRLLKGRKFQVTEVAHGTHFDVRGSIDSTRQLPPDLEGIFVAVHSDAAPKGKPAGKLNWCLVKDDVSHHEIFALAKGSPEDRAKVAAYCVQDCNLVHHLFQKVDVLTTFIEMGNVCSVTIKDIVFRGQGIKLTSFVSQKCRAANVLMPVLREVGFDEGYEGAVVLEPKCGVFMDDPVGVCDFSSLYPSNMIANNLSQDSKVWAKEYDLAGRLLRTYPYGEDNAPGYTYLNKEYDLFKYVRKTPKAKAEKVKCGVRVVRWAQFPQGKMAILPMVLNTLLKERKATRKRAEREPDEFIKNVLDKRQLALKMTANSVYGQCGARTSIFYDKDVAACCTSFGRTLLNYAKTVVERCFAGGVVQTEAAGPLAATAEYVYGDTDSVFFKFALVTTEGVRLKGMDALAPTIELAKRAGELATAHLNPPHDLEYEKTYYPFILLSKKRYVGMLYESDVTSCVRKSMGIVLKRRDNAAIVKDVYGGLIDVIMQGGTVPAAIAFVEAELRKLVSGQVHVDKLKITKSLRSGYKNPMQISHHVLAQRIGRRDPGNKPRPGDRIAFIYVQTPKPARGVKQLQGDKIETPEFAHANGIPPDIHHYISNQIMKPIQQVFALLLEQMPTFDPAAYDTGLQPWRLKYAEMPEKWDDKLEQLRQNEVKRLLFAPFLV